MNLVVALNHNSSLQGMEWTCGRISTGALGSSGSKALLLAPSSALLFIIDPVSTIRSFSAGYYEVQCTDATQRSKRPALSWKEYNQTTPPSAQYLIDDPYLLQAGQQDHAAMFFSTCIFDMPAQLPCPGLVAPCHRLMMSCLLQTRGRTARPCLPEPQPRCAARVAATLCQTQRRRRHFLASSLA